MKTITDMRFPFLYVLAGLLLTLSGATISGGQGQAGQPVIRDTDDGVKYKAGQPRLQGGRGAAGQRVIRDTDDGVKYKSGQNVVSAYEGWVPNPDGTFS